jgi:hypothetical protein
MRWLLAALAALVLDGCNNCNCSGDVAGGHLDVACGQQACVGGKGYFCVDNGSPVTAPEACGTPPEEPEQICKRYLDCASAVDPAMFSSLLVAYGSQSHCWSSAVTAYACEQQCATGLEGEQSQTARSSACGCRSDAECLANVNAPHCNVMTGHCGVCLGDADCPTATPVCNQAVPGGICQACDPASGRGCPTDKPACVGGAAPFCVGCAGTSDTTSCKLGFCTAGMTCEQRCGEVVQCMFAMLVGGNRTCGACSNGMAYAQCVNMHCQSICLNQTWTGSGCVTCRQTNCAASQCDDSIPCTP